MKFTIWLIQLTWRGDGVLGFGVGVRSDDDEEEDEDGIGDGSLIGSLGVGVLGGGLGDGLGDEEELDDVAIGTGDGSLGNGATSFGRKYVGSNRFFLLLQQLKKGIIRLIRSSRSFQILQDYGQNVL